MTPFSAENAVRNQTLQKPDMLAESSSSPFCKLGAFGSRCALTTVLMPIIGLFFEIIIYPFITNNSERHQVNIESLQFVGDAFIHSLAAEMRLVI